MSGLREHSVSFVSPFKNEKGELMTAEKIRSTLGDFSLIVQKPALLGARWSQAFSASDPTVELLSTERKDIPDRVSRNKSVFTDGCGTISSELMRSVWTHLQGKKRNAARKRAPSAVQIRFGGAKGVVVVDPALRGRQICLRPSQVKFPNDTATVLNIAATSSRPIRMFLNRPLICILEFLGVQEEAFLDLQTDAIQEVERARSSFREAAKLLTQHNLGSSFRLSSFMNNCVQQLRLRDDDIQTGVLHCKPLEKALEFCATHVLREIKFRAHVLVPDSYTLIGVPDESESLREGEIYATVWDEANSIHVEVEGRVAITRSPQIHPGDVQMVTAVRRPELMHLRNVVVFSCEGARSLPSCLGGGDLDGDVYNLILNPTLFPTRCYEPGSYVGLPHKQTVNPCTVTDVADFVVEYIESDLVGIISISHLRIADLEDPSCGDCLKLAELASHAVDFPKTGTPVRIDSLPRPPKGPKPDFLANEIMDPSAEVNFYPSKKALGVLFRNVPLQDQEAVDGISTFGSRLTRAVNQLPTGRFGLAPPGHASEDLLVEMDALLADYTYQLTDIAKAHIMSKRPEDRLTEAELISGTIQAKWVDHRKRREAVVSMNMQTLELTRNVRRELKRVVYDPVVDGSQHEDEEDDEEDDEDSESEDGDEKLTERDVESFARASAAWEVALDALEEDNTAFGPASFGIVALGVMLEGYKKARLL